MQAQNQCGKFFKIFTIPREMPNKILKNKKFKIGYDPKLFTKKTLSTFFKDNNCEFKAIENNLVDTIWKRKIYDNKKKFYLLPKNSSGEKYERKIKKILSFLKKNKADFQFITASENNAWLFNIRGWDENYTPVPHSHVLIDKNKNIKFFCNLKKISISFKKKIF